MVRKDHGDTPPPPSHGLESAEPRLPGGIFAGRAAQTRLCLNERKPEFAGKVFYEQCVTDTRPAANAMINVGDDERPSPIVGLVDGMEEAEQRDRVSATGDRNEQGGTAR